MQPKSIHATVTKTQFLDSYLKDLPGGGLFLRTDEYFGLGDSLTLKLQLIGLRDVMELNGVVAWHRRPRAWSSSLPSGIGFQFQGEDEAKAAFLLKFAAGEVADRRRSGPRRNSEHESKLKINDTWVSARIMNLGAGGVMLVAEEKMERGETLSCMVYLDDSEMPQECSVQVERVEKEHGVYIAGARFMRLPQGLRHAFEEMPEAPMEVEETRAQQIIRRSTFPPVPPAKPTPMPFRPSVTPTPYRPTPTPPRYKTTLPYVKKPNS
ncbi:MAG: PilZ domain-containing protein [Deltaproteobacteria bacterium]|nr:PilZ domain-containing protein [Deltaproteobacteria bacterium]MBN2671344.1 PilZ domain-containing protein [Deltaproteobacteria bacterium]